VNNKRFEVQNQAVFDQLCLPLSVREKHRNPVFQPRKLALHTAGGSDSWELVSDSWLSPEVGDSS